MLGWDARRIAFNEKIRYCDNFGHWHNWDDPAPCQARDLNETNWKLDDARAKFLIPRPLITILLNERRIWSNMDDAQNDGTADPNELVLVKEVRDGD